MLGLILKLNIQIPKYIVVAANPQRIGGATQGKGPDGTLNGQFVFKRQGQEESLFKNNAMASNPYLTPGFKA